MILLICAAIAGTWDQVEDRRSDDPFVPPDLEQRIAWSALAEDLVRLAPLGHAPPDLEARAHALGLEVLDAPPGVVALADRADGLRGAGLFAVRLGALRAEVVLHAPHPFYDLGTGEIAGAMFDGGQFRAVAIATANRKAAPGSDPSHAPAGWFQAATDGMAEGLMDPLFVQLHGFAGTTTDACAVVSEGATHLSPAALDARVDAVAAALGCADVRTGAAVPDLAARRNAQGVLLRDRAAFLHLEMAGSVREELRSDAAVRARLTETLLALGAAAPEAPRAAFWSGRTRIDDRLLDLPAGMPALLEVRPHGASVAVSDQGIPVALRGTADGFVVPAAGRGRTLEIEAADEVEVTVRLRDDRGTTAAWEHWRRKVARGIDPGSPPAGGERLRAAVAIRKDAVRSRSLLRLGALHDAAGTVPTVEPLFRLGRTHEAPAVVRGAGVVAIGIQTDPGEGQLGRVTVGVRIDGTLVSTRAVASTGVVPVTVREWLPPGRHTVDLSVDGDPAWVTFEVRRARARLGAGHATRARSEVEIAERAFLIGDPGALDAYRRLAEAPGPAGEIARARIVLLSDDPAEIAALAVVRAGATPEGIEILADAVLHRADDLDTALVRDVILAARDPDAVAVARWLDGPVPGLRPAGVALLENGPDVPAARTTRIDAVRERSASTRARRLVPADPGAALRFGEPPGIPRVAVGDGESAELTLSARADGRVPVVRLLADGPAEWRFDGAARASPGGRVDVAVVPGVHPLEVTSGTLLVLDPEIARGGRRVWERTMSALPATFVLPDAGVAAELVVETEPPSDVVAELDDGHVERLLAATGTSRSPLRAGAGTHRLTITGPEGTLVSVSMRGRLVKDGSATPLPDLPLEDALARIEEDSRRIDRGDGAARVDRARVLAAVGAIEAARRDLVRLDPSSPARAEVARSIVGGATPAQGAPGPASAEAALAEVGACEPLPAGPPDTRARAVESAAASRPDPVMWAAAAEAWLEAGDAVRATDLAMRSARPDLVERSLSALTWTSVPSADRSAGLVAVTVRPDPDAGSLHQRVRTALLASPWPAEEALVLRGNAINVVRVQGTVSLDLFCRDERSGDAPCRVPIRSGATRRTIEIADGKIANVHIDAHDLEIGGPGSDHAIVVRIVRGGTLVAPHAERLATRVTPATPARVRLAGGQVVRVDAMSGHATARVGGEAVSVVSGESIRLPVVDLAPIDLVVEGDALVLLYTGTTSPFPAAAKLLDLPPPALPKTPPWVDEILDVYGDAPSITPGTPTSAGTFRVAAEAISDALEQEETAWQAVGPALTWMKSFGAPWVLVEGWSAFPEFAYGGRAELGTRWNEGRVVVAAEGGHAIEPETASHVVVAGALDQDLPLSSDVDLRGSVDLYAGSWSEAPLLTVDPRAWTSFLAGRPLGVSLGASAIATPTRDLRVDLGGRVTGHEGALPDRAGPYALARWLLGTTTVLSAGGTLQWRFVNDLRSEAYLRPTIDLGVDHMQWLRHGDRAGFVARVTVLPSIAAVEGTLEIRWELTGGRGLRDLPAYEEAFRSLREWPR